MGVAIKTVALNAANEYHQNVAFDGLIYNDFYGVAGFNASFAESGYHPFKGLQVAVHAFQANPGEIYIESYSTLTGPGGSATYVDVWVTLVAWLYEGGAIPYANYGFYAWPWLLEGRSVETNLLRPVTQEAHRAAFMRGCQLEFASGAFGLNNLRTEVDADILENDAAVRLTTEGALYNANRANAGTVYAAPGYLALFSDELLQMREFTTKGDDTSQTVSFDKPIESAGVLLAGFDNHLEDPGQEVPIEQLAFGCVSDVAVDGTSASYTLGAGMYFEKGEATPADTWTNSVITLAAFKRATESGSG
ncbi:MAG: hypothetical protein ACFB51_12570 [Anaerolineae bacterium]